MSLIGWRKKNLKKEDLQALKPAKSEAGCIRLAVHEDVVKSKLESNPLLRTSVYLRGQIYTHTHTHYPLNTEWVDAASSTPRNILSEECGGNYKHVPPVMAVCVMGDTNIGAAISWALKLAVTRSRMLFLPKQRRRHLLALPRHSESMSKVPPLFDTAVCRSWTRR